MELIQGRTLEEVVQSGGPLGAAEATLIGLDCCRALAAIHQAGLLHRDLKARNVMREQGGRIVVMDLGTARAQRAGGSTPGADFVGTPLYLAPEIFRGEPASVRSDIYSLGVLLYYLVTATLPVTGATAAAVAEGHAADRGRPLREARPDLPEEFLTAVQRALSPDATARHASAAAFADALSRVGAVSGLGGAHAAHGTSSWRDAGSRHGLARAAIVSVALLLAAGGGAWISSALRPPVTRAPETRLLMTPAGVRVEALAASPDGQTLVLAGQDAHNVSRLWMRPLSAFEATPVADTEGAAYPFWSPDGRSLGYFARGKLWIVSAAGGAPRALASAPMGRGAAWGADERIVFAATTAGPLLSVSTRGGEPTPLTMLDAANGDSSHRWPVFMPDGRRVAFLRLSRVSGRSGTFVGASDGSPPHRIVEAATRVAFIGAGGMLYAQDTKLLARPIDPATGQVTGEPRTLAVDLASRADTRDGVFSVSSSGLLVYGIGEPVVSTFDVYDRNGQRLFTRTVPGAVRSFSLSPDGQRLLLQRLDPEAATDDIWTLDLSSDRLVRLTMDAGNDTDPIWSPDGREVIFSSDRATGRYELYRRLAEAGESDRLLWESRGSSSAPISGSMFAEDWSRDGRSLLLVSGDEGARRVSVMELERPEAVRPLQDRGEEIEARVATVASGPQAQTAARTSARAIEMDEPAFSPDGRFVAYHSTESGVAEVYIVPRSDARLRWQVSPRGGVQPRWRADGGEIFYLAPDGMLVAASVEMRSDGSSPPVTAEKAGQQASGTVDEAVGGTAGGVAGGMAAAAGVGAGRERSTVRVGAARPVLATGVSPSFLLNDYAVSGDGSRIIVHRQHGGQVTRLAVILNWQAPF